MAEFKYADDCIIHTDEEYQALADYDARVKSYEGYWDPEHVVRPEELAANWLYYYGPDDAVKCWHCRGTIRCWYKAKTLFYYRCVADEHKRFYPKCVAHYIRPKVSLEFDERYKMSWVARYRTFEDHLEAEKLAKEGFYYDEFVRCVYCHRPFNMDDPVIEHQRNRRCPRYLTEKIDFKPNGRMYNKNYLNMEEQVALGLLPMKDVFKVFALYEDRLITFGEKWTAKIDPKDMARAGFVFLGSHDDRVACYSCHGIILDWGDADPFEAHQKMYPRCSFIKSLMDKSSGEGKCIKCGDDADTVFLPCGHLKSCSQCAKQLEVCDICDKTILATTKIFLS